MNKKIVSTILGIVIFFQSATPAGANCQFFNRGESKAKGKWAEVVKEPEEIQTLVFHEFKKSSESLNRLEKFMVAVRKKLKWRSIRRGCIAAGGCTAKEIEKKVVDIVKQTIIVPKTIKQVGIIFVIVTIPISLIMNQAAALPDQHSRTLGIVLGGITTAILSPFTSPISSAFAKMIHRARALNPKKLLGVVNLMERWRTLNQKYNFNEQVGVARYRDFGLMVHPLLMRAIDELKGQDVENGIKRLALILFWNRTLFEDQEIADPIMGPLFQVELSGLKAPTEFRNKLVERIKELDEHYEGHKDIRDFYEERIEYLESLLDG